MTQLPSQNMTTEQQLLDYQAQSGEQPKPIREIAEDSTTQEDTASNTILPTSDLIPLQVPVPPQIEKAIGYHGDARYVAFYWQPAGDEVMYDDGRMAGDGDWWAWLAYVEHTTVAPHLVYTCPRCNGRGKASHTQEPFCPRCVADGWLPFNFGHSDCEAEHWLIVDRQERKAYAAPVAPAIRFLNSQWPPLPQLSSVEIDALFDAFQKAVDQANAQAQPIDEDEIEARLMEAKELCADMSIWLNNHAQAQEALRTSKVLPKKG